MIEVGDRVLYTSFEGDHPAVVMFWWDSGDGLHTYYDLLLEPVTLRRFVWAADAQVWLLEKGPLNRQEVNG